MAYPMSSTVSVYLGWPASGAVWSGHVVIDWLQRNNLRLAARNFDVTSAWMAGLNLKSSGLPLQLRHCAKGQIPCFLVTLALVMTL